MNVALLDGDNVPGACTFPNLALMKLSAWHKKQGNNVEWWMPLKRYDLALKSKVFDFTPEPENVINADTIKQGGSGYGLSGVLPDEIEHLMPDYSIYPQFREAYGFLTRGCPRRCPFCIVGSKEGHQSRKVADLDEFWSGQRIIKLLDPNLLACREHETLLQQLADSGSWIDFTQGLDIRLVTDKNTALLQQLKIKRLHFAWDNPSERLEERFKQFKAASRIDYARLGVYVLTNFYSSLDEDLYRIYTLRDLGYSPYVMIYDKQNAPHDIRRLQRWVNNRIIFRTVNRFEDYVAI